MRPAATLLALVLAACVDGAPEPLRARFESLSEAETPWPSDAFRVDGRLHVTSVPFQGDPRVGPAPVASLVASLSELDGFSMYTPVFFPTRGLPLPEGAVTGQARFVDLDSPGARVLDSSLFYRASTHELVALAPRDGVLTAGHRYACRVTSPFLDASTEFTVGHPLAMTEKMRDVAAALPLPAIVVTKTMNRGAELDELLGAPTTTRPGIGDPRGIVHDALERAVFGTFDAPSFLPRVEADAAGNPRVQGTTKIPFFLTLPPKPWPATGVPILVFQHGLNASRAQVAAVANDYARAGFATIGIDALGHGDRALYAKDVTHNFTGAPGPDGLADGDAFSASATLFDFAGGFDARVVRDNFRQAVVDLTVLVRLLAHGDLSAIAPFDTSKLAYTGESFGSILGLGALAMSPDLQTAALSVGGGGIFLDMLARSPIFAQLVSPFVQAAFDTTLDVSNPVALPPDAQRSLALLQTAIMPGDPLAFAPLIRAQNKRLLLLQARADEAIPNESGELLATAAGATFVALPEKSAPPRFSSLPAVDAPWDVPASNVALVQLSPALHTMFTSFEDVRRTDPNRVPLTPLPAPQRVDNPIELAHRLALRFVTTYRVAP